MNWRREEETKCNIISRAAKTPLVITSLSFDDHHKRWQIKIVVFFPIQFELLMRISHSTRFLGAVWRIAWCMIFGLKFFTETRIWNQINELIISRNWLENKWIIGNYLLLNAILEWVMSATDQFNLLERICESTECLLKLMSSNDNLKKNQSKWRELGMLTHRSLLARIFLCVK